MVKEIHITLDLDTYKKLVKAKKYKTWREVLLDWLAMKEKMQ